MPFTSKRSQSMMGKTNAKKSKQVHGEPSSPDEAPAPATKRCRYGWPAPVAADAPPPSVSLKIVVEAEISFEAPHRAP